ncbi:M35 family metallo-endopeptidase [Yoonia sp. BS5-3]|uniref:M35 family metallo-endopeptidase n=1 Tax=Yoonia phaeophyticola TaxID=3137369 RepID=A0ABZ2V121_9RHOB
MRLALVLCGMFTGSAASAQQAFECNKADQLVAVEALEQAKVLTLSAAAAVGDTPEYARWFGTYSERNAEQVRATLKAVVTAMRSGAVTLHCNTNREDGCNEGEYAWVYPHRPLEVQLCPPFFELPPLTALQPSERRSNYGTREGTMVHEISHFLRVADTWDHCYSRRECREMATDSPNLAVENADSFQYYTEDVTYYARQPLTDKPSAARQD